ncbi:hypothetical protein [Botrimarina mediterranea]|uniref:Outer membrane efflux protein n=1 Tax=Botrimarina mediterranea TaxID=2528022 RepID=A0A518KCX9_9BACT|nr:hypothetical protein [Botrimarina mediterranea]QDV75663.1 hypothetical protein Spa11_38830 [Botrimarina mediterranea]QDV80299.1 hypothetical protein K2D_39250 [Planctomycetes bacterium K2D]
MRRLVPALLFPLVGFATLAPIASAQINVNQCYECGDALSGGRAVQVAAMEERLYRRLDHPARMRALRMEIKYAEARIDSLRLLQREYNRVNRFGTGNALTLSAAQVRLELMRENMVLRDLREQLILEQRYNRETRRAYAVQAAEATQRITAHVALESEKGEPTITIINH